jgi:hypothetical protein
MTQAFDARIHEVAGTGITVADASLDLDVDLSRQGDASPDAVPPALDGALDGAPVDAELPEAMAVEDVATVEDAPTKDGADDGGTACDRLIRCCKSLAAPPSPAILICISGTQQADGGDAGSCESLLASFQGVGLLSVARNALVTSCFEGACRRALTRLSCVEILRRSEQQLEIDLAVGPVSTARLLLTMSDMVNYPVEHGWTIPKRGERLGRSLPPRPRDGLEEASRPSWARIAAQPGAISTRATFASVLSMGTVGAGVFFLMHSIALGNPQPSQDLAVAGLQTMAAPVAILAPVALTPTPTALTPTPTPAAASETSTATPIPVLALPRAPATATRSQPRPKPIPRVRLYPFPVPTPLAAIPIRSALTAEALPEEASGPNPYDEVQVVATKAAPPDLE